MSKVRKYTLELPFSEEEEFLVNKITNLEVKRKFLMEELRGIDKEVKILWLLRNKLK
jgi:hypothetical protein